MKIGSQYLRWAPSDSLEELQRRLAQDLAGRETIQEALKKQGAEILDCYVQSAKDHVHMVSRVFTFSELDSAPWPFKLLNLVKEFLPQEFREALERSKLGFLAADAVNAQVWPRDRTIGLFSGLSNFLFCCFGALLPVDETWLVKQVPEGALTLGRRLRRCYRGALFAEDHHAYGAQMAESLVVRSALANSFPSHRQLIEGFGGTAFVNTVLRFVLLHEVAHVVAGHKGAVGWESQQQELEADKKAIRASEHADARLPDEQKALPWAGVLCMSALETHARLSGVSFLEEASRQGKGETHPVCRIRRMFLIEEAIELLQNHDRLDNAALLGMNMSIRQHIDLSSLLVEKGFEPLSPFFSSSLLAQWFPDIQLNFPDHVPEVVRKVEMVPIETLRQEGGKK